MKSKFILSFLACLFCISLMAQAQDNTNQDPKKATIVIKTIDDNGNENTETINLEGEELDQYIQNDDGEGIQNIEIIKTDGKDAQIWISKDGEHRMNINHDPKPFLGIHFNNEVTRIDEGEGVVETNSLENGILVDKVVPNSGAEAAGIQAGDIIKSIDGNNMGSFDNLSDFMRTKNIGDQIKINLLRDGNSMDVVATLGERVKRTGHYKFKDHEFMTENSGNHFMHHKRKRVKRDPCKPFIGFYNRVSGDNVIKISRIIPNTPAEKYGLEEGDIVLEMDGIKINSHKHLLELRDAHDTGDRFKLLIERDGNKKKIKANFNDCPKDQDIASIPELNNPIGIDAQIKTSFSAFPNPTQGNVFVAYEGTPGEMRIKISDISGKVLIDKSFDNFEGNYQETFDFSQAPEGTLILQIENEGEVVTEKIILQKGN